MYVDCRGVNLRTQLHDRHALGTQERLEHTTAKNGQTAVTSDATKFNDTSLVNSDIDLCSESTAPAVDKNPAQQREKAKSGDFLGIYV